MCNENSVSSMVKFKRVDIEINYFKIMFNELCMLYDKLYMKK